MIKQILLTLLGCAITNSSAVSSNQDAVITVLCNKGQIESIEFTVSKPGKYVSYVSNYNCDKRDV